MWKTCWRYSDRLFHLISLNTGGSLCSKGKTPHSTSFYHMNIISNSQGCWGMLSVGPTQILQVTNPWRNLDAERSHFISSIFFFINSSGSKVILLEKSSFAFVCFSLFNSAKSQWVGTKHLIAVPGAAMLFASMDSKRTWAVQSLH